MFASQNIEIHLSVSENVSCYENLACEPHSKFMYIHYMIHLIHMIYNVFALL